MEPIYDKDRPNPQQDPAAETALPKSPLHRKLLDTGITLEELEAMGVGAILCQSCPDCKGDIFYPLTNEYYSDWKEGKPVAMILKCGPCNTYKFDLRPEEGEVLYEKEGTPGTRGAIPMAEHIPSLPFKNGK